ncbi:hypothetical protein FSARC_5162 [Fusarium sarcochroum]|uniref:Zn(2)-C6 fungal-type domain-containing protein n=1 Tax=Fusarium sarcochroum TaxID=1208366 RepID=A0A8H4XAI7_9HYPO|nr:hypothetical protein FSARC_5162 [Fusarium sarcochroum]
MAGVPTSRACNACREQKKKCDGQKPTCGRCKRLQLACVGNGLRRFNFKRENFQVVQGRARQASKAQVTGPLRPGPSNTETQLISRLVSTLEIKDIRYDIMSYGTFILDLPRHVGSSPAVDASIAALVSSFDVLRDTRSRPGALALHINAVSTLRKSLQDTSQACTTSNMAAIWLIYVCKHLNGANDQSVSHGEVLVYLIYETAKTGQLDNIDPILLQLLSVATVCESFLNPRIHLDQNFWDIINKHGLPRPMMNAKGHAMLSVEPQTAAEIAFYIRDTEKYLYQIRCTYNILLADYPVLVTIVEKVSKDALQPGASLRTLRISSRYYAAFGVMLALTCTVNRVIRIYDGAIPELATTAKRLVDDIISNAESCNKYRPISAGFMPVALMAAWASTPDGYRTAEIESWLITYQSDFESEDYMQWARNTKQAYQKIEERWLAKMGRPAMTEMGGDKGDFDPSKEGCTIL